MSTPFLLAEAMDKEASMLGVLAKAGLGSAIGFKIPILPILLLGLFLVGLMFVVRFLCAAFSDRSFGHMRRHPILHTVWAIPGVGSLLVLWFLWHPGAWPPNWLERRGQRRMARQRIETAGGWDALQRACEQLTSNRTEALDWSPPATGVYEVY